MAKKRGQEKKPVDWYLLAVISVPAAVLIVAVLALLFGERASAPGLPETAIITRDNVAQLEPLRTLAEHTEAVRSLAFAPDGEHFVSGSFDDSVRLWQTETMTVDELLSGHENDVRSVSYALDGEWIVSGSFDHTVRIWDTDGDLVQVLVGPDRSINSVAISSDRRYVAAGVNDGTIWIWDLSSDPPFTQQLNTNSEAVFAVAYGAGDLLISGSADNLLRLWTTNELAIEAIPFGAHSNWVFSVALSRDNRLMTSTATDGSVKLWDMENGVELQSFPDHVGTAFRAALNPAQSIVAVGVAEGMVFFYEIGSAAPLSSLDLDGKNVLDVAFAPDGRLLLTATSAGEIIVWGVPE